MRARVRCATCRRYVFEVCEPGDGYRHVRCVLGHVQVLLVERGS